MALPPPKPLPIVLTLLLERWLRIPEDDSSARHLERLAGRSIQVTIDPPGLGFVILGAHDRLQVLGEMDDPPDVSLRGTPLALGLAMNGDHRTDLHLEGDASLLQDLQRVLQTSNTYWRDLLEILGSAGAATPLVELIQQLRSDGQALNRRNIEDTVYFLQEEIAWLPSPGEMETHRNDLAELRETTDRLQERIQQLEQPLARHPVTAPPPEASSVTTLSGLAGTFSNRTDLE